MYRTINPSEIDKNLSSPDDVIYYNISIPNNTEDRLLAKYNQILQVPILDNPSLYFLSIVRYSVPGQAIPVLYFTANTYYVTLSYNGNDYTTPLIYPTGLNTLLNDNSIYAYQQIIDMINVAFATSFLNLISSNTPPPTEPPYMTYDASSNLCSLYCQQRYDPIVAGSPTIEIYMNNVLYYFFDNFVVTQTGIQSASFKDYRFIIKNLYNNAITSDPNNPNISGTNPYYKNIQEYSTLYNFVNLQSIAFTSCLFQTAPEYIPTTENQIVSGEKILTDFEPLQEGGPSIFRGYLQYYASLYRLINLTANTAIRAIDIQIFYKDNLGNTYPLYIPRGQSVSIKLMFVKKSLYRSAYRQ